MRAEIRKAGPILLHLHPAPFTQACYAALE